VSICGFIATGQTSHKQKYQAPTPVYKATMWFKPQQVMTSRSCQSSS